MSAKKKIPDQVVPANVQSLKFEWDWAKDVQIWTLFFREMIKTERSHFSFFFFWLLLWSFKNVPTYAKLYHSSDDPATSFKVSTWSKS